MAASRSPSIPDAGSGGEWDQDEINEILETLEEAEGQREEIIEEVNGDEDEENEKTKQFHRTIERVGIALSVSIILTLLSLYSLWYGFSQSSLVLIIASLSLLCIVGYHNWRWNRKVKK